MYTRRLALPPRSFLLLGPRGTGKTTWMRRQLPQARWYNMLLDRELLRLMRDPATFRHEVQALPRGSWIVVDEVQKLPSLLDEIHDLLASAPRRWRFALTGSSARRLRRGTSTSSPGAWSRGECCPSPWKKPAAHPGSTTGCVSAGCRSCAPSVASARVDLLEAYVETYLAQEIRAEAVVRSLESFTRFLEVVALANAQVTNIAALARDAAVARPTVQGYFDVLVDTLIGAWLPAWRPRAKVKGTGHPKFYLFDSGVVRALSRRLREPLEGAERGTLLETLVYHELRAHVAYTQCGGEFSYYRTPSGSEVDFVWVRGRRDVGIEVKASARWREEYGRVLVDLHRAGVLTTCYGVYLGARPLQAGGVTVLPLSAFLRRLADGDVLR